MRLTDAVRPADPMRQLRARFPHCVHLEWARPAPLADGRSYQERLRGRDDLDVAAEFVRHVRGTDAGAAERELLRRALAPRPTAEAAR